MTFWENVWQQVAKEMPRQDPRPKTWAGFLGAMLTALVLVAIWFPIRLIYEILKAIDLSDKPDHTKEAQRTFPRRLFPLARPSEQERIRPLSFRARRPSPPLHDAFFEAFEISTPKT